MGTIRPPGTSDTNYPRLWIEFLERFPDEEAYLRHLESYADPEVLFAILVALQEKPADFVEAGSCAVSADISAP